jgi:hypothetical protein
VTSDGSQGKLVRQSRVATNNWVIPPESCR